MEKSYTFTTDTTLSRAAFSWAYFFVFLFEGTFNGADGGISVNLFLISASASVSAFAAAAGDNTDDTLVVVQMVLAVASALATFLYFRPGPGC